MGSRTLKTFHQTFTVIPDVVYGEFLMPFLETEPLAS